MEEGVTCWFGTGETSLPKYIYIYMEMIQILSYGYSNSRPPPSPGTHHESKHHCICRIIVNNNENRWLTNVEPRKVQNNNEVAVNLCDKDLFIELYIIIIWIQDSILPDSLYVFMIFLWFIVNFEVIVSPTLIFLICNEFQISFL